LKGGLELHFTYDEEFGGLLGPGWLLEQKLTQPDLVIAAGFSYDIVTAHNACLQLEITVHGKAGHGAMPETGGRCAAGRDGILNAIYGQLPELKKIKSKVPGIDSPTMLVGRIDGGTNTNVVPGKVVMKMDRRMIPEEDPVAVEAQVRALIEMRCRTCPASARDPAPAAVARAAAAAGFGKLVESLQRNGRACWARDPAGQGHAAVCGCAPVRRARDPGGAVWGGAAHGAGIECEEGGREAGAGGFAQGDQGGGADAARFPVADGPADCRMIWSFLTRRPDSASIRFDQLP
jgi:acetylornithine deacetylase/succinyl-diaminopimelate desuccinylase-like protein